MNFVHTTAIRTSAERKSITMQWLLTALLFGMLIGTRGQARLPQAVLPLLERYFGGLALSSDVRTLWDVFLAALLPMLLMLGGLLLCGLCAVGQPFAVCLLLLRGMALGIAGAGCFSADGIRKGLLRCAVLYLPTAFCSAMLLAAAARDALTLSAGLQDCLLHENACGELPTVRKKLHRNWLVLTGLALAASLLHTALLWLLNSKI